jgi:hypothetical protein
MTSTVNPPALVKTNEDHVNAIRAAHTQCRLATRQTLTCARQTGIALLAARKDLEGRESHQWSTWCRKNLPWMSERSIRNYIRLAENWERLETELLRRKPEAPCRFPLSPDTDLFADIGYSEALSILSSLDARDREPRPAAVKEALPASREDLDAAVKAIDALASTLARLGLRERAARALLVMREEVDMYTVVP